MTFLFVKYKNIKNLIFSNVKQINKTRSKATKNKQEIKKTEKQTNKQGEKIYNLLT